MKKIMLLLIIFSISIQLFAQIKTISTTKKENIEIINNCNEVLDKNFMGKDVDCYLNQLLYVLPKNTKFQKYGYSDFYYSENFNIEKYYSNEEYKSKKSNTNYNELVNRYFYVKEILPHPKQETSLYSRYFYFKLEDKENGEILYFQYNSKFSFEFPFLSISFYENYKDELVGEKIILRGKNWRSRISKDYNKIFDINTGDEIFLSPTMIWTVGELVIEDKYNTLSYIISNEEGNTTTIDYRSYNDNSYVLDLEYSNLLKKLDLASYNSMLENKIRIGMSKELLILAWGKPDKINKSSYNEQWVYGSQYVYLENNKITAWN